MKQKKHKHTKKLIIAGVVVIILIAAVLIYFNRGNASNAPWEPVEVTAENLPEFVESLSITQDLPKDSSIYLKIGSEEYTVSKGTVTPGIPENPDIVLTLPEEYIAKLGYGPCSAIREARENGELGIDYTLSNAQLAWKYKGMLGYKDCFGGL